MRILVYIREGITDGTLIAPTPEQEEELRERMYAEDDGENFIHGIDTDSGQTFTIRPDTIECRACGERFEEAGDGYDGLCPDCADKAARD